MSLRARVSTPVELGNALREFRLAAKVTQRQLAAELGISQRWISELKQGKTPHSDRPFVPRLARTLRPHEPRAGRPVIDAPQ